MRGVMMMGAWSAALLGLAAPAMAADPVAEPASAGAGSDSPQGVPALEEPDGTASDSNGRVVIMSLSKPRPEPEPRPGADPRELRKHGLSKRPQGASD